jgi:hypothetical protein
MNQETRTKAIKVTMPRGLWDEVVDSIAADVVRYGDSISRRSDAWSFVRRGRGGTMTTYVSPASATYIASYLGSRVGLHVGFSDGKGEAHRSEQVGMKVANEIASQVGG